MFLHHSQTKHLSPEQRERIGHRYRIIRSLRRVVARKEAHESTERARWIIEQKLADIEAIMSSAPKQTISNLTPNAETIAAMEEADAGGGEVFRDTTEEAFEKILAEDESEDHTPPPPR